MFGFCSSVWLFCGEDKVTFHSSRPLTPRPVLCSSLSIPPRTEYRLSNTAVAQLPMVKARSQAKSHAFRRVVASQQWQCQLLPSIHSSHG